MVVISCADVLLIDGVKKQVFLQIALPSGSIPTYDPPQVDYAESCFEPSSTLSRFQSLLAVKCSGTRGKFAGIDEFPWSAKSALSFWSMYALDHCINRR
jgi:hypothetical protein